MRIQRLGTGAVGIVLVIAAAAVAASGCKTADGPGSGELAPDFVLPRLDGRVQKLSNYRGSVVMVNLWATWCPPCLAEMPLLDEIVETYGSRGLVVLGIASDDDNSAVERFVQKESPRMETLLDPGGAVGTQYGITGYPETFFVDREGRLQRKFIGPLPEVGGKPAPEVTAVIEAMLGG